MKPAADNLSAGARRAFQAADRRTAVAETRARDAEARARAAEERADRAETGLARLDRLAETLAAVAKRLDRLESREAVKVKAAPTSINADKTVLYGVQAIADHLGIRRRQAQHLIDRGVMPSFRIGRTICGNKATLTAWIAQQENGGA